MRSTLILLTGTLLAACGGTARPTTPAPISHAADAAQLEAKTVAIVDDETKRARCTGVWVSPKAILTAAHCVHDEPLAYAVRSDVYARGSMVERSSIRTRSAELYALDVAHDLALLCTSKPAPEHAWASTSSSDVVQGTFAQSMGHSIGLWYSYSSGDVAGLRVMDGTLYVQTTAPLSPGNSGGGLFDADGSLIGIAHAYFRRGQNLNMYVHKAHVDALLWLYAGACDDE